MGDDETAEHLPLAVAQCVAHAVLLGVQDTLKLACADCGLARQRVIVDTLQDRPEREHIARSILRSSGVLGP